MRSTRRCAYSRVYHEETLLAIGCKAFCEQVNIVCTLYILFSHLFLHYSQAAGAFWSFRMEEMLVGFQYDITVSLCLQERKCCEGYYGINCEKCPGSEGQPCFGNGVCVDGINGTGVCQCNQGFNGTACESCQDGKYGIHCDQGIRDLKAYTAYSVNSYLICTIFLFRV